ncbi:MAG: translation initiation factor IF-2 N-terminal domain-containing protein, partial [candidate division Zixibacteria bacterium]|nr:translation initiation factor IF-2 N-terminal domain-containing protein [candidate division Zixibacteria bacterium]
MAKDTKRIYQLAKEYNISSNAMLVILRELKFEPKSHMSVATADMIKAVTRKFTEEKQQAKKGMEQRAQIKQAGEKKVAQVGSIKVINTSSTVAGVLKKIEKKQRKKDRRKKKGRQSVDQAAVAKSFKTTMANLGGGKQKKKYHRGPGQGEETNLLPENIIEVNEFMTVAELANQLERKPSELIAKLFEMGMMATINQR